MKLRERRRPGRAVGKGRYDAAHLAAGGNPDSFSTSQVCKLLAASSLGPQIGPISTDKVSKLRLANKAQIVKRHGRALPSQ